MRVYFLLLLVLFWSNYAISQDPYFATVVKGGVTKKDGSPIHVGTKLFLSDRVNFASKESMLILLNPDKGRVVVSAKNAVPNKENQFTLLIKDYLNIDRKTVRLSTNGIQFEETPLAGNFTTDSTINKKVLIIDTLLLSIPQQMNLKPDNKSCFFYLQPLADKSISRPLNATDKYLKITKDDIEYVSKQSVSKSTMLKLILFNRDAVDNKIVKTIATFEPAFITRETCATLIGTIKSTLTDATDYAIIREVRMQLYYTYGKPDDAKINEIYDSLR